MLKSHNLRDINFKDKAYILGTSNFVCKFSVWSSTNFDVAILKILLFGHSMAGKLPKKGGIIGFLAIKWPISKIFKIATSNL